MSDVIPVTQDLSGPPTRLHFGFNGWPPPGPNGLLWEQGQLTYSVSVSVRGKGLWGEEGAMKPSGDDWARFWKLCDELEVWSWPAWYGPTNSIDGLQFGLELEIGGRQVRSTGQIGSPDRRDGFSGRVMKLYDFFLVLTGWNEEAEKRLLQTPPL